MAKSKKSVMGTEHAYAGVGHVVQVSSNIGRACECCHEAVGGGYRDDGEIAESINHYIQEHGYRLLYLGQETHDGHDGKPWQITVAILGAENAPPSKPPSELDNSLDGGKKKSGQR